MAKTITLTPRTCNITNTKSGNTPTDKFDPTLSHTLADGTPVTYGEGEYNNGTTVSANYIDIITDDLVARYTNTILPIYTTSTTLDETSVTIELPGTQQLTATVLPADATDKTVVWSTDDELVATVDSDGLITAVGVGTCGLTCASSDGQTDATIEITVTDDA